MLMSLREETGTDHDSRAGSLANSLRTIDHIRRLFRGRGWRPAQLYRVMGRWTASSRISSSTFLVTFGVTEREARTQAVGLLWERRQLVSQIWLEVWDCEEWRWRMLGALRWHRRSMELRE